MPVLYYVCIDYPNRLTFEIGLANCLRNAKSDEANLDLFQTRRIHADFLHAFFFQKRTHPAFRLNCLKLHHFVLRGAFALCCTFTLYVGLSQHNSTSRGVLFFQWLNLNYGDAVVVSSREMDHFRLVFFFCRALSEPEVYDLTPFKSVPNANSSHNRLHFGIVCHPVRCQARSDFSNFPIVIMPCAKFRLSPSNLSTIFELVDLALATDNPL